MAHDKNKWVDEVLDSTAGMMAASPRAGAYERMKGKLAGMPKARRISLGMMSAAAACLLVLFGLNLAVVSGYTNDGNNNLQKEQASIQDIVDYYELGSNNTGL